MVVSENDNFSTGFIKLFRSIKKHWLWQDERKLKWWVDILIETNHSDNKVNIGYELIDCKRGQAVKTLQTWAKEWRVDVSTVRRFLNLLENDNMICIEPLQKTTRITLCNYDSYNDERHAKQSQSNRKAISTQSRRNTNNNDKNNKNDKNINTRVVQIESEKRIAPEMQSIFIQAFPKYPKDSQQDFTSCLQIAYKIAESSGLEKQTVLTTNMEFVLTKWHGIVDFISTDKWYQKRSITQINNEWQSLIQSMNSESNNQQVKKMVI